MDKDAFHGAAPESRGKGKGLLANQQIQLQLKEMGVKQCVSFTSVANISQIKTSLKAGYVIDQYVAYREVNS